MIDFTPFFISFKLAFVTTIVLFLASLPLSWWLCQSHSRLKPFFEAIVALPLVLPPSVLGFYMLICFSPNSFLGSYLSQSIGVDLVFSFTGLVVASCFYSLPFMVQPLQSGFEAVEKSLLEASYLGGKSKLETFFRVVLPNSKSSIITALIITFSHTIGEFGVVLMIGGSIPEKTKVASVAIYEFVEILDYKMAHIYSLIMLFTSFLVLFFVYYRKRSFGIGR